MNHHLAHPFCQPMQVPSLPQIDRLPCLSEKQPINERRELPVRLSFGGGVIERLGLCDAPTPKKEPRA